MIAQYTQAGIVSELKRLAVPASVDSIPSSAMQEDHVSMGWSAARKLRRAVDGLTRVLAIELLTAARALDLRAPLSPGAATGAVVAGLRAGDGRPGSAGRRRPRPRPLPRPRDRGRGAYVATGAAVRAAETAVGALQCNSRQLGSMRIAHRLTRLIACRLRDADRRRNLPVAASAPLARSWG